MPEETNSLKIDGNSKEKRSKAKGRAKEEAKVTTAPHATPKLVRKTRQETVKMPANKQASRTEETAASETDTQLRNGR